MNDVWLRVALGSDEGEKLSETEDSGLNNGALAGCRGRMFVADK